jgi:hypothetical protein
VITSPGMKIRHLVRGTVYEILRELVNVQHSGGDRSLDGEDLVRYRDVVTRKVYGRLPSEFEGRFEVLPAEPTAPPARLRKALEIAIERLGLSSASFPTTLETGGYSDDCHGCGGGGPGFDRKAFDRAAGGEYDAKAVKIDLGDGRCIVFTTVYTDQWNTLIAIPEGCTVTGTTLHEGSKDDEES